MISRQLGLSILFSLIAFFAILPLAVLAQVTVPKGFVGEYRLAFVTSFTTAGSSSDVNYYNDFVTAAADSSPTLNALGTTWTAFVSTPSVNADDNTLTNPDADASYPVYNLAGQNVVHGDLLYTANDYLWDDAGGSAIGPIDIDQTGAKTSSPYVWTVT